MSKDQKQICQYCAAWKENGFAEDGKFMGTGGGECRLHGPTLNSPHGKWPETQGGDWCLEFQERPIDPDDRASRLLNTKYMHSETKPDDSLSPLQEQENE